MYNPLAYYLPQATTWYLLVFPSFMYTAPDPNTPLYLDYNQYNCNSINLMAPPCKLNYSWHFGDGDSLVLSTNNQTSHTYDTAGVYIVSLTSNVTGVDTTIYDTIFISGFTDTINIVAPDTIVNSNFLFVHGTAGYTSYQWSILSGSATLGNPNSASHHFLLMPVATFCLS